MCCDLKQAMACVREGSQRSQFKGNKVNFKINDKSIRSVIHWMFVQYFKAFLMSIR